MLVNNNLLNTLSQLLSQISWELEWINYPQKLSNTPSQTKIETFIYIFMTT